MRELHDRRQILSLCRKLRSQVILPIDLEEQRVVSLNSRWLRARSINFLLSDWSTIAMCHHKRLFGEALERWGLGEYLPRTLRAMESACVVKKSEDCWGENAFLVRSPSDLERVAQHLRGVDYLIQEYVPGDHEFASHVLANGGEIVWMRTICHQHATDHYLQGINEPPICSDIVETDPIVCKVLERILEEFSYSGICCFDYKLTPSGQLRLFEMNPRMGSSLGFHQKLFPEVVDRYRHEAMKNELGTR